MQRASCRPATRRSEPRGGLLLAACLLALVRPLAAAPSQQDPDAPLDVRNEDESRQLATAANELYRKAKAEIAGYLDKLAAQQLPQVNPQAISRTRIDLRKLMRLGERLELQSEAAGFDYRARATELETQIFSVIDAYRQLPGFAAGTLRDKPAMFNTARQRATQIPRLQQLISAGDFPAAEKELLAVLDELDAMALWYDRFERGELFQPWSTIEPMVQRGINQQRRDQALAELTELRQQQASWLREALDLLPKLLEDCRPDGRADWQGETLAGPELVERIGPWWQGLHLQALRARAYDWARDQRAGLTPPSELDKLTMVYEELSRQIVTTMAAIVQADAQRAAPAEAEALYPAYVQALGASEGLLSAECRLVETLTGPLDSLAARSPQLAEDVARYRAATDDLLRWRRRLAASQARRYEPPFVPLDQLLLASAQATTGPMPLPGLVPAGAASIASARLSSSVPAVLPLVAQRLVDQQVWLADCAAMAPGGSLVVSRYRQRGYAIVALPGPAREEIARLKSDLLIGSQSPPLTLEAAAAVASAERGDCAAIGGRIVGVYLEPLTVRFANLPASAAALTPLGAWPEEPAPVDPKLDVLLRVDVKPTWVAHEYFFRKLP